MSKKNLGNEIVGGVEGFGRFYAEISAIIATLIAVAMIIGGIFALVHKTTRTKSVQGTIISANCVTNSSNANETDCTIQVTFPVNGNTYGPVTLNSTGMVNWETNFNNNQKSITIYYDPNNPSDSGLLGNNTKILGWVLIFIGIFLIIISWATVWLVKKYKWAAFGEGAIGGVQLLKNI